MSNFETQVSKEHYNIKEYDTTYRFISYFHQIEETLRTNPRTVLEVGVGNKIVSNYLREYGVKVKTCDFDKGLKPDVVADVRKLPFRDREFDTVIAFEVLEHLPFEDFETALKVDKYIFFFVAKFFITITIEDINSCHQNKFFHCRTSYVLP